MTPAERPFIRIRPGLRGWMAAYWPFFVAAAVGFVLGVAAAMYIRARMAHEETVYIDMRVPALREVP